MIRGGGRGEGAGKGDYPLLFLRQFQWSAVHLITPRSRKAEKLPVGKFASLQSVYPTYYLTSDRVYGREVVVGWTQTE